jgi:tripartite-type tricarboxylate transporter receptor subunit TctC
MPEAGFPNLVIAETWGMLAPANIMPAAARRLRAETVKVLQKADILGRLNSQGTEISTSTPEQLRDYITEEISRYRDIIQRAGIKAN